MCWKRKKPDPMLPASRRALLFAINKYGGGNDLNGCINDQKDFIAKLNALFPGFDIRAWKDSEVTTGKFISELDSAIGVLRPGDTLIVHYSGHGTTVPDRSGDEPDEEDEALYVINGTVSDDIIGKSLQMIPDGATVVLFFDSCFSGTITRAVRKIRFVPNPEMAGRKIIKRRHFAKSFEMNHLVFSGCSEDQTSADAYINGRYNGAFTFYALYNLRPGITFNGWYSEIRKYLPSKDFDQIPTLEGPNYLSNKVVFI